MRPSTALAGALFATHSLAHMQLVFPAPFNATNNPHRTTGADPYLQFPYDCCGPNDRWEYPCRGYVSLLGTPEGAPTAIWAAGSAQSWNISGIGNHYGGSCQVGFSTDKGETFRVATSYEGNCPHRVGGNTAEGQNFDFHVPSDLEAGVQLFAWIWYNREQEFNMNCAAVNITAPGTGADPPLPSTTSLPGYGTPSSTSSAAASSTSISYQTANNCTCLCTSPVDISTCTCTCPESPSVIKRHVLLPRNLHHEKHTTPAAPRAVAFADRPIMLIADDGNGCLTPKTTAEVKFPNPGPDVVVGDGEYPLELPSGQCGGVGQQAYNGSSGNDGHA